MDPAAAKKSKICQICEENPSKYLCPRCGAPYCSLACYKSETKHLQCSESFYRDCVTEHVRNEQQDRDPESSKKMKEILQRFHEEYNVQDDNVNDDETLDELDSDDDEPLEKRLEGIDLNDSENVWKHLTEDEKREFQNLVRNLDGAGEIIPEWTPWWYDEYEKKLVTEVSDESHSNETENPLKLSKRQPEIYTRIPKMSDLTKVKPSEHVAKGLINVVAAYVWVIRLYNGDILDSEQLIEVASSIICLSSYLNNNGLFKNLEHALADVPVNACKVPALSEGGAAIQTNLNRDVWMIIKGPKNVPSSVAKGYILSALTECYTVFTRALKIAKNEHHECGDKAGASEKEFSSLFPSRPPIVSADVKLLTNSKRKLLYLLAFANEFIDNFRDFYEEATVI